MSRATDILSRVFRNLEAEGKRINDILDEEIYDEMSLAQDKIISEIYPDRIIEVPMVTDLDSYDLTTDAVDEANKRKNIASIKVAQIPSGWTNDMIQDFGNLSMLPGSFTVIDNLAFSKYKEASINLTGQPRIGTVIGGKLLVYPTPTADFDGDILKLYCYLSSSAGKISDVLEPDLMNIYDEALEMRTTSRMVSGKAKAEWLTNYKLEMRDIRSIQNRKFHTMTRPSIEGTW